MGNPTLLNCRSDLVIKIPVRLGEWVDVHFTENVQSVQRIINFFDKAIDKKTMSVDPPAAQAPEYTSAQVLSGRVYRKRTGYVESISPVTANRECKGHHKLAGHPALD